MTPRWSGIEAVDLAPEMRDIFLIGDYNGKRRGEIVSLRREQFDMERSILRVEEIKTGEPIEFPITRQLAAILERRLADGAKPVAEQDG